VLAQAVEQCVELGLGRGRRAGRERACRGARGAAQGQQRVHRRHLRKVLALTQRVGQAAGGSVLVFEFVSNRGLRPASFCVVTLIIEAGAVDVGNGMKWSINLIAERVHASGLIDGLNVGAMQCVLESGKTMLPARGPRKGQLRAGQEIVLARALVKVRGQDWISVEIPVALHAGGAVGVAGTQAERRPVGQLHADVAALQGV